MFTGKRCCGQYNRPLKSIAIRQWSLFGSSGLAQSIIRRIPLQWPELDPRPVRMAVSKWHWNCVFFKYFTFLHLYHSTNAPCLSIRFSPTLYSLSNLRASLNNTHLIYALLQSNFSAFFKVRQAGIRDQRHDWLILLLQTNQQTQPIYLRTSEKLSETTNNGH